jgi:hypothetical protein
VVLGHGGAARLGGGGVSSGGVSSDGVNSDGVRPAAARGGGQAEQRGALQQRRRGAGDPLSPPRPRPRPPPTRHTHSPDDGAAAGVPGGARHPGPHLHFWARHQLPGGRDRRRRACIRRLDCGAARVQGGGGGAGGWEGGASGRFEVWPCGQAQPWGRAARATAAAAAAGRTQRRPPLGRDALTAPAPPAPSLPRPTVQGVYYSLWPAPGHVHPKLRLKEKPSLISLAGGVEGLPVTDPAARATPLGPAEWRDMLRAADDANKKVAAGQEDPVRRGGGGGGGAVDARGRAGGQESPPSSPATAAPAAAAPLVAAGGAALEPPAPRQPFSPPKKNSPSASWCWTCATTTSGTRATSRWGAGGGQGQRPAWLRGRGERRPAGRPRPRGPRRRLPSPPCRSRRAPLAPPPHIQWSERPREEEFSETPVGDDEDGVPDYLKDVPKDAPVMVRTAARARTAALPGLRAPGVGPRAARSQLSPTRQRVCRLVLLPVQPPHVPHTHPAPAPDVLHRRHPLRHLLYLPAPARLQQPLHARGWHPGGTGWGGRSKPFAPSRLGPLQQAPATSTQHPNKPPTRQPFLLNLHPDPPELPEADARRRGLERQPLCL